MAAKKKLDKYTVQMEIISVVEREILASSLEEALSSGRELVNEIFISEPWREIDGRARLVGVQSTWSL